MTFAFKLLKFYFTVFWDLPQIIKYAQRYMWLATYAKWKYVSPIDGGNHIINVPYYTPGYAASMDVFFKTNLIEDKVPTMSIDAFNAFLDKHP